MVAFMLFLPSPPASAGEDEGRAEGHTVHIAPFPKPEDCDTARCRAYWAALEAVDCYEAQRIIWQDTSLAYSDAETNLEILPSHPKIERLTRARINWSIGKGIRTHLELSVCGSTESYREGQKEMEQEGAAGLWGPQDEEMFHHLPELWRADISGGQVIRDVGIMHLTEYANCGENGLAFMALAEIFEEAKAFRRDPDMTYFLLLQAEMTGAGDRKRLDAYEARLSAESIARIKERARRWRTGSARKQACRYSPFTESE
jgi:hypothetical protein